MRLHHVVLFCRDTDASAAWYERAGFERLRAYEGMVWFRLGEAELMLHPSDTAPSGEVPELYVAVADVDVVYAHARQVGLGPVHHQAPEGIDGPFTTPWGSREFELYDPDGHRWGFVQA
jgi:catechol 2,3-dioxygenase-like lactoylglutathione lyase family enzyme